MARTFFKILATLIFVFAVQGDLRAQLIPDASSSNGRSGQTNEADLPDSIKESLAKQRLKSEKEEYQDLVARGEEAAKLGEELHLSLEKKQNLSSEDLKKIERLEKIVKKIRDDLGAKDDSSDEDEETNQKPGNLASALDNIKENTANLLAEIKRIGRHSISVVAIKSTNSLLKMFQYLKFSKN